MTRLHPTTSSLHLSSTYAISRSSARFVLAFRVLIFAAILSLFHRVLNRETRDFGDALANSKGTSGGDNGSKQKPLPSPLRHPARRRASQPRAPPPSYGKPFVTVQNGSLVLEDGTPFRFASLNAPELLSNWDGTEFESEDTFRTLAGLGRGVTRTYTLKVPGTSPHIGKDDGHILGWNGDDWVYKESLFVKMDRVLANADKYNVRVIVPIINHSMGDVNINWVGDWVDLIRLRKNPNWSYNDAMTSGVDFWTDPEMIDSFKKLLNFLLNRINTVNGRRYGDDPTILAWETTNEGQLKPGPHPGRAIPGSRTVAVAKHFKSLAPRTLVMDGSYAKSDSMDECYEPEVLDSPDVMLLSYHYYGTGDVSRIEKDCALAREHGKVFIAGEYGFLNSPDDYGLLLGTAEREGAGGSLVWSLRPHSAKGGFKTHRENENNCAYHAGPQISVQGQPMPKDFDKHEATIMNYIRHASFSINREPVPGFSPPSPPKVWSRAPGTVTWQGAPWGATYEVWSADDESAEPERWQCIAQGVIDAVPENELEYRLPDGLQGKVVKMRGMAPDGTAGRFSNVIAI